MSSSKQKLLLSYMYEKVIIKIMEPEFAMV